MLNSLKTLLMFSESAECWSKRDNPLHQLVKFTSSTCLCEVSDVWRMWLNKTVSSVSVSNMHASRNEWHTCYISDIPDFSFNFSKGHFIVYGDNAEVQERKGAVRAPEVRSYLEVGSCYAEHVVNWLKFTKSSQN